MARALVLPPDVLYHLLNVAYYDERAGEPDYPLLTKLSLVFRPAQTLLFRWVRLHSIHATRSFKAACTRRPSLGRAVRIANLRLRVMPDDPGILIHHFVRVLESCPNLYALFIRATIQLPPDVLARVAKLPAATSLRVLHLSSTQEVVTTQLLEVFPNVDRLYLDLDLLSVPISALPLHGRSFVELSVTINMATKDIIDSDSDTSNCTCLSSASVLRSLRLGMSAVDLETGLQSLHRPSNTLRSLSLHVWNDHVASIARECERLAELRLWFPCTIVLAGSQSFFSTLPRTLEHLALPDNKTQTQRTSPGTEADILALTRLGVVSLCGLASRFGYNAWINDVKTLCAQAGVNVRHYNSLDHFLNATFSLEVESTGFPPRGHFSPVQFARVCPALEDEMDDGDAVIEASSSRAEPGPSRAARLKRRIHQVLRF
ncbi:hypothetical protein EXIGLDRAFT_759240 [Exidia glandulosa HHB12029]|uniref:F-box domain-containing protein n=1 Tax=Exidia glandulosa HHB12029 TaxID=1314781 RepID=A0A165QBT7_EXIGL|nr:hypothetical protein EXIGLDRAFT_759240 [Exidia glandulosa HHB12029]